MDERVLKSPLVRINNARQLLTFYVAGDCDSLPASKVLRECAGLLNEAADLVDAEFMAILGPSLGSAPVSPESAPHTDESGPSLG